MEYCKILPDGTELLSGIGVLKLAGMQAHAFGSNKSSRKKCRQFLNLVFNAAKNRGYEDEKVFRNYFKTKKGAPVVEEKAAEKEMLENLMKHVTPDELTSFFEYIKT